MSMTPYRRGRIPGTLTSKQVESRAQKIAGFLAGCNAHTVNSILEKSGCMETLRAGGVLDKPAPTEPTALSEKLDVGAIQRELVEAMRAQSMAGDANAARVLSALLEKLEYEAKADAFHIHIVPFDIKDRVFVHRTDEDNATLMRREDDGSVRPYVPCR